MRPERLLAERIVERLDREFGYHFHVEAVLWEREPLVATQHFQDGILPPHETDVVVVILWSRLGVLLPEDRYVGAITGKPVTGTEWEFEDALKAARESGVPQLLLYRKLKPVMASLENDAKLEQQIRQKRLVEDFMGRWFGSAESGNIVAASQTFDSAEEFEEKLYDHLRAILEQRVRGADDSVAIRWHEAPFRGLLSFDVEHSPVFFGRARARNEVRELLANQESQGCAFVLVLGASGSGKSSLVKAGVLPDVMLPGMIGRVALCRYAVFRLSENQDDAVSGLAGAILSPAALPELKGLRVTQERLAALLRDAPQQVNLPIEQGLAEAAKSAGLTEVAEARVVLILDQLEELFTIDRLSHADRQCFVAAIDALARSGLVWVIATMRSDFFGRLETFPELARLARRESCYLLLPPTEAELGQIIREPAREAGLRFETRPEDGVQLDEVLREAAAVDRDALPLLSFVLDELWRRRSDRGVLTFAAYRELGGLEGALARRAEAVFEAQVPDVRQELPRVLRALVAVDREGAVAARTAALARFASGTAARKLIDAFAAPDARLFVLSTDSVGSEPGVRVAHEALLDHWSRAKACVEADRADLQLEARLSDSAARWRGAPEKDRESLLLPSGLPLEEALDLFSRRGDELDESTSAFVTASMSAEAERRASLARRTRNVVASLSGLALVALLFGGFALMQRQTALQRLVEITAEKHAAQSEQDETEIGGPLLAAAAYEESATPQTAGALLSRLMAAPGSAAVHAASLPGASYLGGVALASRGTLLAAVTSRTEPPEGFRLTVFSAANLAVLASASVPGSFLCGFPGDSRFAVAGDGTLSFYELTPANAISTLITKRIQGGVAALACMPNPSLVAFASRDGSLSTFDYASDALHSLGLSTPGRNCSLTPSPSGAAIAAVCKTADEGEDAVAVFRLSPPDRSRVARSPSFFRPQLCQGGCSQILAFSPDESKLAWFASGHVHLLDYKSGTATILRGPPQLKSGVPHYVDGLAYPQIVTPDRGTFDFDAATARYVVETDTSAEDRGYPIVDDLLGVYVTTSGRGSYGAFELSERTARGTQFPMLGAQPLGWTSGGYALFGHSLVVAGKDKLRSYDLDAYRTQLSEAGDVSDRVKIRDGGDGQHAVAFDFKTGAVRRLDASVAGLALPEIELLAPVASRAGQWQDSPEVAFDPSSRTFTATTQAGLETAGADGKVLAKRTWSDLSRSCASTALRSATYVDLAPRLSAKGTYLILGGDSDAGCMLNLSQGTTYDARALRAGGWRSVSANERYAFAGLYADQTYLLPAATSVTAISLGGTPLSVSADDTVAAYESVGTRTGIQLYDFKRAATIGRPMTPPPSGDTMRELAFTTDGAFLIVNYAQENIPLLAVYVTDPRQWQRELCHRAGRVMTADEAMRFGVQAGVRGCERFRTELFGG